MHVLRIPDNYPLHQSYKIKCCVCLPHAQGDVWGLFTIDNHGLITLMRDVNDQDLGRTYTVTLTATDSGTPSLSDSTQVQLRVINCTMTQFYFQQPYNYLEINEGSSIFVGASANPQIFLGEGTPTSPAAIISPNFANNPFGLLPSSEVSIIMHKCINAYM